MRAKTVQINWHDKLPIFSVDFDHNYTAPPGLGGWRFATGGGDNNVRLWRLRPTQEREAAPQQPAVEFLASLNRHTAPVNVVRFSPVSSTLASAGDDGVVILWRQQLGDGESSARQAVLGAESGAEDDGFVEPEVWRPVSMLRGSLADICDLAWSPDGNFLVSASVDNTARIWDAREARCLQVLADHTHYVQGVVWDPLGEFVATQSSDRSLRVYRWVGPRDPREIKSGSPVVALMASHYSMPLPSQAGAKDGDEVEESADSHSAAGESSAFAQPDIAGAAPNRSQRLFHDDNLASFFRRPSISPDGRLLAAAAGVQRDRAARNTCYVWARDSLLAPPALSLAGHQKPVVATRWAPCQFAAIGHAGSRAPGWLAGAADAPGARMMLAVASQGAVAIYDTSMGGGAIGLMGGLHYAAITDLAWSQDGSHLVLTSIDGFATVASIDQPSDSIATSRPHVHEDPPLAVGVGREYPLELSNDAVSAQATCNGASKGKRRLAPTLVGHL
ncbi:Chromatin assembly factor 1 subunit [Coemansia thaxteri]|uniref:Chromatin assembly factor 1 subunit n=1 Tax=Coemansia thaxteri TaxID=2663907 RepID=A0A9W8EL03_9FUNG|nr:Chromatin assembly factor 1 subunit [Coemansia thaxteri]KAJ2487156.1 Chromatin assembly factor 1 subunit [Coemansia sp. RSA 2320]